MCESISKKTILHRSSQEEAGMLKKDGEEAHAAWKDRIERNPNILFGKPVVKGTRLAVDLMFDTRRYQGMLRLCGSNTAPVLFIEQWNVRFLADENIPRRVVDLILTFDRDFGQLVYEKSS
jgi:hypothetical protein